MQNWLYVDVSGLLVANDNYPDTHSRILTQFQFLIGFLHNEGLLESGAGDWLKKDIRTLKLYASDLTEEGRRLFSPPVNAYFKWLSANDRDNRKPISMRSLEAGLRKIRAPAA